MGVSPIPRPGIPGPAPVASRPFFPTSLLTARRPSLGPAAGLAVNTLTSNVVRLVWSPAPVAVPPVGDTLSRPNRPLLGEAE